MTAALLISRRRPLLWTDGAPEVETRPALLLKCKSGVNLKQSRRPNYLPPPSQVTPPILQCGDPWGSADGESSEVETDKDEVGDEGYSLSTPPPRRLSWMKTSRGRGGRGEGGSPPNSPLQ